jgi:hypothetical protein
VSGKRESVARPIRQYGAAALARGAATDKGQRIGRDAERGEQELLRQVCLLCNGIREINNAISEAAHRVAKIETGQARMNVDENARSVDGPLHAAQTEVATLSQTRNAALEEVEKVMKTLQDVDTIWETRPHDRREAPEPSPTGPDHPKPGSNDDPMTDMDEFL